MFVLAVEVLTVTALSELLYFVSLIKMSLNPEKQNITQINRIFEAKVNTKACCNEMKILKPDNEKWIFIKFLKVLCCWYLGCWVVKM